MNELGISFRNFAGRASDVRDDMLDLVFQRKQPRHTCSKLNSFPAICCGRGDGRWTLCSDGLSAGSIVYSVGIGFDIGFDLDMIKRFGCVVNGFDPTLISKEWLSRQKGLPSEFVHHDIGLAHYTGTASFRLPPKHSVSFSMSESVDGDQTHDATVMTLTDIMKKLDHSRIDVLKIDIEGAEYQIIDDLVQQVANIGQLLIEFHDRMFPAETPSKSKAAMQRLESAGFELFHVSRRQTEFSFIGPSFPGS